jgi:hypothetical protein
MKQITRYSIGVTIDDDLGVDADPAGEWVKYEDIKHLLPTSIADVMEAEAPPSPEAFAEARAALSE